jgi:hypothetical protein
VLAYLVNVEPDESRQFVFDNACGELSKDPRLPGGGIRSGFADQRGFICGAAQRRQGRAENAAKCGARGLEVAVNADFVDVLAAGP